MFQDDMVVINGIIIKGRHVVIPEVLKTQALDQLHIIYMGIEKTKFLAHKSVHWVNINDDIEKQLYKWHYMSYISADKIEGQDNTS